MDCMRQHGCVHINSHLGRSVCAVANGLVSNRDIGYNCPRSLLAVHISDEAACIETRALFVWPSSFNASVGGLKLGSGSFP